MIIIQRLGICNGWGRGAPIVHRGCGTLEVNGSESPGRSCRPAGNNG